MYTSVIWRVLILSIGDALSVWCTAWNSSEWTSRLLNRISKKKKKMSELKITKSVLSGLVVTRFVEAGSVCDKRRTRCS
jgi:hypothetical protein